ncbi:uncharacterized protein LOC112043410 [Bicyclus anynana]|uniref:Uncharacterized protein LOC112043410 n=1 Tax=Bicyclus anynana TaxID=110368 RepID=A0A6J1MJM8_BICAN|nr:uncharacterized protein LOC112043410 [Bicyclus anynana]
MQETVTNTNERKSLFSTFLEVLEARDKQAQADRELQEERYQRRTQRIYDFHDRQQRSAEELRRCLDYVSQHAHVLESVLRSAAGDGAPLAGALVRQAAALQRCMAQCVANAARIRQLLTAAHRPQMDTMLAKMEAELSAWTAFLQRAVEAAYNSEVVIDNLHNLVAEQKRCVREVSASGVFASLGAPGADAAAADAHTQAAGADADADADAASPRTPVERRPRSHACSTPIARD